MAKLAVYRKECKSVFGLNGYDEDSATYALGWVLLRSPSLLRRFIAVSVGSDVKPDLCMVSIDLQQNGRDKGFTDLEIKQQSLFHIIVEAKKNWVLPSKEQLKKYTDRFKIDEGTYSPGKQLLITMSAASNEYAERMLDKSHDGFPTKHISWFSVLKIIDDTYCTTTKNEEKLWLRELRIHIKRYNGMTSPTDNQAYCVVLSSDNIRPENSYTYIDVVVKDNHYFHPVGLKGWPVDAPNYIAFRRRGELLSVHHVDSYEVTNNLVAINKFWPLNKSETDYFVYKLGPAMNPDKPLKNGKIYATGRVWCALDTLLSGAYETIAAARDETKRRNDGV